VQARYSSAEVSRLLLAVWREVRRSGVKVSLGDGGVQKAQTPEQADVQAPGQARAGHVEMWLVEMWRRWLKSGSRVCTFCFPFWFLTFHYGTITYEQCALKC